MLRGITGKHEDCKGVLGDGGLYLACGLRWVNSLCILDRSDCSLTLTPWLFSYNNRGRKGMIYK